MYGMPVIKPAINKILGNISLATFFKASFSKERLLTKLVLNLCGDFKEEESANYKVIVNLCSQSKGLSLYLWYY